MCAIKGPVVMEQSEDTTTEMLSPRSTLSSGSGGSESSSSEQEDGGAPVWQRTIPKGRRCKPLSFSGMILYDENGKQVELSLEELQEDDEEYFSPQRNLAEQEPEFQSPHKI